MILPLLLAIQTAPPPAPPADEEIVVLAQKMRLIEVDMKVGKRDGRMALRRCRVTRPSGRAELDAIPCAVAEQCMVDGAASKKQLVACVEGKSNARMDALVAQWRAAS